MSYSQLILRDCAEIVWPLDDINNSSSYSQPINFFTSNINAYSASINVNNTNVVGIPIVFGGGTLLEFTSSAVCLSIPAMNRFSELYNNKDSVISFWFRTNSGFKDEYPIFKKRNSNIGLFIQNNYFIFKYGNSASVSLVSVDIADINEPTHIVVGKTNSGLYLMINGISYTDVFNGVELSNDSNHILNDYIDFYGPPSGTWEIDSISLYPNMINESTAKRHYIYGLGKNVGDDVFYAKGGNIYNFSTSITERMVDINWEYADEWSLNNLVDLNINNNGIGPLNFSEPFLYSYDNKINTASNSIYFTKSGSSTQASYIEINKLITKIEDGSYPFFLKIKLNGSLPDKYIKQRLISYGTYPDNEILKFDLYNNNGTYQVVASVYNSSSVSFNITNPLTQPSIYLGMKFIGISNIYFAQEGNSIQTASFSYEDSSGYGLDPMTSFMPPASDTVIRLGSSLNYDSTSFSDLVYNVEQFTGSIERFFIGQKDLVASSTYSYLNTYNKTRYEINYSSNDNRFKIKSYGYGSFNIHSISMSEYINDTTQKIGSNIIKIGYPDILSASQVNFYVTVKNYDGNTIQEKTKLSYLNYLNFLNNRNLYEQYLQFDFEIYSDDLFYFPPRIKYFKMQAFKSSNNNTIIRDQAGQNYTIYPTSSSNVYLPEIRYTPTTFLKNTSGLKINNNIVEFSENIMSRPLDPTIINGLKLWLDARFPNGLRKQMNYDDSRLTIWKDLSDNTNDAIQQTASIAPIYRVQSKNILRSNQLTGADNDDLSFIIGNNSFIEATSEGVVSGDRGLKITPSGSSVNSYLDLSFNTASITTFPNQSYSVVGSIKLTKPQTASYLHQNARKIIIYNNENGTDVFTASSIASTNQKGTYSLSAVFTTSSATLGSKILFYNGSFLQSDYVYWDNLGVYPVISGSAQISWVAPLTLNDHATVKFNGKNNYLISTASSIQPSSIYIVAKILNNSIILQSTTASILYSNSSSYFVSYGTPSNFSLSNNKYNIFSIINDGTNTELFINGISQGIKNIGAGTINSLIIGRQLQGDISSILLYEGSHTEQTRTTIENWLSESFYIS